MQRDGALYYWDYLQLDRLLACQRLESAAHGEPAHDEMLFIVVHQAFELWFKQIIWEIDAVRQVMARDVVADRDMSQVVARLDRVTAIQPLLIHQLEVLETMTPLDFLDFRDHLVPASGFQSVQFRLIENKLGIDPDHRMRIGGAAYTAALSDEHADLLRRSEQQPSLLAHVERWLQRTPFLHFGTFDFWRAYRQTVADLLDRERAVIERNPNLGEHERQEQLANHAKTRDTFAALFDTGRWEEQRAEGRRRLSHEAFLAALLINLYRDEPVFHMPFRLLTALVEIDEGFTAWRQRHALMVHRMIGGKIGTGGTTGHRYLQATSDQHRVFRDLFDLSTFLVPRSALPQLPPEVTEQMQFRYAGAG
ncbi:MAG TPA: tryptophan 2,3-dioxygenase family protein [Nitriliruptorales bacterium]|nr:tryptophan 2,3-dioxygenase family protein [Nitriliruptorales bacterium]